MHDVLGHRGKGRCRQLRRRNSRSRSDPGRSLSAGERDQGCTGPSISCWCFAQEVSQDDQLRFAAYFGDLGSRKKAPEPLRSRAEGIWPRTMRSSSS